MKNKMRLLIKTFMLEDWRKTVLSGCACMGLLEVMAFAAGMSRTVNDLYDRNWETGERYLNGTAAAQFSEVMRTVWDLPAAAAALCAGMALLVIPCVTRQYREEKSMCTLLRLPISRTWLYAAFLIPAAVCMAAVWLGQFLLFAGFYGIYRLAVPQSCLPPETWRTFLEAPAVNLLYPFLSPGGMGALAALLVLLPSLLLLLCLMYYSGQRWRRGLPGIICAAAGCFLYLDLQLIWPVIIGAAAAAGSGLLIIHRGGIV